MSLTRPVRVTLVIFDSFTCAIDISIFERAQQHDGRNGLLVAEALTLLVRFIPPPLVDFVG